MRCEPHCGESPPEMVVVEFRFAVKMILPVGTRDDLVHRLSTVLQLLQFLGSLAFMLVVGPQR